MKRVKVKSYTVKAHTRKARKKSSTATAGKKKVSTPARKKKATTTAKKRVTSPAKKISVFRGFDVYEKIPKGWKKDGDTLKAPGKNMVFITNGRSPLKGGKRALLKVTTTAKKRPAKQIKLF